MTHYASAEAWAQGPDRVYGELARVAVDLLPGPLDGRLVLDAGSGTGAASRALTARGARVLATDQSPAMLGYQSTARPPAVAADVAALPLPDCCVDGVVASFVLSHVDRPEAALAELARVTRSGGMVLVTAFTAGGPAHPVKVAVDGVLARYGYTPPAWYAALKGAGELRVGVPASLTALATGAGLHRTELVSLAIDVSVLGPTALAAWRLGMAQTAPWLAALPPAVRSDVDSACIDAVAATPPTPLGVLVLLATT